MKEKIMNTSKRSWDTVTLILIIILGLFQIFRCMDYPGLYLDSVNPDYLAVQYLFPESGNGSWTLPHSLEIPFLAQLYHGTVTAWVQVVIISLFGEASLFTVRAANILYIIAICWMLQLICKKLDVNRYISLFLAGAVMLSPQVFSFIRTQYYIKLPGTFLMLCAFYLLLNQDNVKQGRYVVFSGVLNGLAFYSYFIYLFFAPAMILFCIYNGRSERSSIKDAFAWFSGFCAGSVFYVIGYFDLLISSTAMSPELKVNIVRGILVALLGAVCLIIYLIVKYYDDKKVLSRIYAVCLTCVSFVGVIGVVCFRYIWSVISPALSALNIQGKPGSIIERLQQVASYWYGIMSNNLSEELLIGEKISRFTGAYMLFLAVLTAMSVAVVWRYRKALSSKHKGMIMLWILLAVYGMLTVAMVTRMGGQHYTGTFFITFLCMAIEMDVVYSYLKDNRIKTKCTDYFIVALSVIIIFAELMNATVLCTRLKATGGSGLFTAHINTLAYDALEQKRKGIKEYYIFPEWGFMCGFDYLTMNQVKYTTVFNAEEIQRYVEEGYTCKICIWEDWKSYVEGGVENFSITELLSGDGETAFYIIEQSANDDNF